MEEHVAYVLTQLTTDMREAMVTTELAEVRTLALQPGPLQPGHGAPQQHLPLQPQYELLQLMPAPAAAPHSTAGTGGPARGGGGAGRVQRPPA